MLDSHADGTVVQLTRNANDVAAQVIRQAILDGRLPAGSRLKEGELASRLGISRTPIREALLILQAEGLIESIPNRGATVRTYSAQELDDTYQLRALLEGHAAGLASTRISQQELRELRSSCKRFESLDPDDIDALVKENMLFHTTVLDASGSPRLIQMTRKVVELPLVYRSFHWYSPTQKQASAHYHDQLTRALEARDVERAKMIMMAHILGARDTLVAHFEQTEGVPRRASG